jgi:hypothetical protein
VNGTFVLPQMLADGSWKGGKASPGGFPLKLHREFLFPGFLGLNVMVAVYRGALYRGLIVSVYLY